MNSDNKKINGWINLNKPEGISSSKCVITLKKILNVKKIASQTPAAVPAPTLTAPDPPFLPASPPSPPRSPRPH